MRKERNTSTVSIRLTGKDLNELKAKAKEQNLTLSELIKSCIQDKYGVDMSLTQREARIEQQEKQLKGLLERLQLVERQVFGLNVGQAEVSRKFNQIEGWFSHIIYHSKDVLLETNDGKIKVKPVYWIKKPIGGDSNVKEDAKKK